LLPVARTIIGISSACSALSIALPRPLSNHDGGLSG
jgi:hypothetical protein